MKSLLVPVDAHSPLVPTTSSWPRIDGVARSGFGTSLWLLTLATHVINCVRIHGIVWGVQKVVEFDEQLYRADQHKEQGIILKERDGVLHGISKSLIVFLTSHLTISLHKSKTINSISFRI